MTMIAPIPEARALTSGRAAYRKAMTLDPQKMDPYAALAWLYAENGRDLKEALRTFSLKCSGKGIVVILSDFMDKAGYEDALRYLVAHESRCRRLLDR